MLLISRDIDHDSMILFRKKKKKNCFSIQEFSMLIYSCTAGLSGIYRSILRAVTEEGSQFEGCGKSGRGQVGDLVC